MDLRGKKALVTGGAVRIGRAICLALARAGADVTVHYRSSSTEAASLCAELEAMGVTAWARQADLSDAGAIDAFMASVAPVDILVNNAAVFNKGRLDGLSAQALLDQFVPNLFAPMLLTKAFAAQGRPGAIVNLVDRRITSLDRSCVAYLLAKDALATFTQVAALELAPRITVNAVAPGPILPPPGEDASYIKEKAGPVPLGKPLGPDDVADAVLYLLKSDAITGQILFVDGGQHLLR
jgi:pteridine reductase